MRSGARSVPGGPTARDTRARAGRTWTRRLLLQHASLLPLGWRAAQAADSPTDRGQILQGKAESLLGGLALSGSAPAHVVALAQGDDLGIATGGRRDINRTEQVTTHDLWHLGSLTKSFTATLVAILHEQGRLDRNANVRDLMADAMRAGPGLGRGVEIHEGWAGIDVRDVLTHQSGLPLLPTAAMAVSLFAGAGDNLDPPDARRVMLAGYLRSRPPPVPPGGEYSNVGYVLAAAMIEAAVGDSWERLVLSEIVRPLGLHSAGFGPPLLTAGPGTQPVGHLSGAARDFAALWGNDWFDSPAAFNPAGRLHMDARDAVRWVRLHAERDPTFLTEDSWHWLHTPPKGLRWASGWIRDTGNVFIWMRGSNRMWYSLAAFDPSRGLALFLAGNSGRVDDLETLGPMVQQMVFGK